MFIIRKSFIFVELENSVFYKVCVVVLFYGYFYWEGFMVDIKVLFKR